MSKNIPEWEFFKRIEKTELDVGKLKPTTQDSVTLGQEAIALAFISMAAHNPSYARKMKDLEVNSLRSKGLSPRILKMLEHRLLSICEQAEELAIERRKLA